MLLFDDEVMRGCRRVALNDVADKKSRITGKQRKREKRGCGGGCGGDVLNSCMQISAFGGSVTGASADRANSHSSINRHRLDLIRKRENGHCCT